MRNKQLPEYILVGYYCNCGCGEMIYYEGHKHGHQPKNQSNNIHTLSQENKQEIFNKYHGICQLCNKSGGVMQVHHINYDKNDRYLILLHLNCHIFRVHHAKPSKKEEYRRKFMKIIQSILFPGANG